MKQGWEGTFQMTGTVDKGLGYTQGQLRIQFALNPGVCVKRVKTAKQESKVETGGSLPALKWGAREISAREETMCEHT